MTRTLLLILALGLSGCLASAPEPDLVPAVHSSSIPGVDAIEHEDPGPMPEPPHRGFMGKELTPIVGPEPPPTRITPAKARSNTNKVRKQGLVLPSADSSLGAIQRYRYDDGKVYKVYVRYGQITAIYLEPGEVLTSEPAVAHASEHWDFGTGTWGQEDEERSVVYVHGPDKSLVSTMHLLTNRRRYAFQLVATNSKSPVYMVSVEFVYPRRLVGASSSESGNIDANGQCKLRLNPAKLSYAYNIKTEEGAPAWYPTSVFDTGEAVYIVLPPNLSTLVAPALFVSQGKTDTAVVSYETCGNIYIVRQLFDRAQLRVGETEIVTIEKSGKVTRRRPTHSPQYDEGVKHDG